LQLAGGTDVGGVDLVGVELAGNTDLNGAQKAMPHESHGARQGGVGTMTQRTSMTEVTTHRGRGGVRRRRRGQMGAMTAALRRHAYFGMECPSLRRLGRIIIVIIYIRLIMPYTARHKLVIPDRIF
jgi:hypothetical protein